jgi:hypothetical protein
MIPLKNSTGNAGGRSSFQPGFVFFQSPAREPQFFGIVHLIGIKMAARRSLPLAVSRLGIHDTGGKRAAAHESD